MPTIGIDLGTTNTAAAYAEGEEAEIIDIDADKTMRSVVTFEPRVEGKKDEVLVGEPDYLVSDPNVTFAAVKRHMGTDHPETVEGEDLEYQPEMFSSLFLKKVIQEAEDYATGVDEFDSAVITVPARFSETARTCTEAAATYAYIDDVPLLLPEPSAACVAYDIEEDDGLIEQVAVYDLGGGTFDLSVVNIVPDSDGPTNYSVTKNGGKQKLGGEDFDERLAEYLIEEFEADTGVDVDELEDSKKARRRVKAKAKEVKEKLSSNEEFTANIPFLAPGEDLNVEVTREKFEELTGDLVDETIEICENVFDDLGYPPSNVDTVLTVGGSTKMPQVENAVKEFFDQDPVGGVNPDRAVALGAGEIAKTLGARPTLPSGDSDDENDGDSDGALPAGDDKDLGVVSPEDIGFELASGKFEVLIEDGMSLPATSKGLYTTEEDDQESAVLRVFRSKEGVDSDIADDHEHIKTFELDNIRPAPKGEPDIAVRFEMDKSGIVRAEAWDESIGEDSAADSELEMEPKGGGEESESTSVSDGSGPRDSYSPPNEGEIKSIRDDLPPVA